MSSAFNLINWFILSHLLFLLFLFPQNPQISPMRFQLIAKNGQGPHECLIFLLHAITNFHNITIPILNIIIQFQLFLQSIHLIKCLFLLFVQLVQFRGKFFIFMLKLLLLANCGCLCGFGCAQLREQGRYAGIQD